MATHGSRAGEVTQDQTEAITRNLVIVCVAASTLTRCTMVGAQCVTATYESSDCHANGTPVTAAEKAEGARRHIETCRHLY